MVKIERADEDGEEEMRSDDKVLSGFDKRKMFHKKKQAIKPLE